MSALSICGHSQNGFIALLNAPPVNKRHAFKKCEPKVRAICFELSGVLNDDR
jgi:hypothetical protein